MSAEVPNPVPNPEFKTSTMFLAAWLLCGRSPENDHGMSFLRVERQKNSYRTKVFVFSDPNQQGKRVEEEYRKSPQVRLLTFRNAWYFLLDRLKAYDENQTGGAR